MTTEFLFETIPFAGEQEWLGQELGEYEEEAELGRGRGRAGRRRRPLPFRPRPRPYRPRFPRPAAAMTDWIAAPAEEPAADSGQPCSCAQPCNCASCQGGEQGNAEPIDQPVDEELSFETGAGTMFETLEFGAAGEFETGRPTARGSQSLPPCTFSSVRCPPRGAPSLVLDGFKFDRSDLDTARHRPLLEALARRILASQRTLAPIRTVLVVGHADKAGQDPYNTALGGRRADTVARALCRAIERLRPGGGRGLSFKVASCGEEQAQGRPEQSRRVEIFLPPGQPPSKRRNPPDHSHCGVPRRALQREAEFEAELRAEYEAELDEYEEEVGARTPRRAQTQVQPRLCIFQNHPTTSHRNHFRCQADRTARRIAAQASPTASNCPRRVGGTPYDSGADIIAAISAAHRCQRRRLDAVHIFSHSGSNGVFGTTGGSAGLYIGTDPQSRAAGARAVTDIPATALAENSVIFLHGCNTASGTDNFARALYNHLAASLRDPKVFGHTNLGCAGRDNSWREYSRRSPNGTVQLRSLAPRYQENGCCS